MLVQNRHACGVTNSLLDVGPKLLLMRGPQQPFGCLDFYFIGVGPEAAA